MLAAAPAASADVRLASGDARSARSPPPAPRPTRSWTRARRRVPSGSSARAAAARRRSAVRRPPRRGAGDRRRSPAGVLLWWRSRSPAASPCSARPLPRQRRRRSSRVGTGTPCSRSASDGAAVLAYPDRAGDTAVSTSRRARPARARGPYDLPDRRTLTKDAPERRHRPLDMASPDSGPFVLDLVQTRAGDLAAGRRPEGAERALCLRRRPARHPGDARRRRGHRRRRVRRPAAASSSPRRRPAGRGARRTLPGHRRARRGRARGRPRRRESRSSRGRAARVATRGRDLRCSRTAAPAASPARAATTAAATSPRAPTAASGSRGPGATAPPRRPLPRAWLRLQPLPLVRWTGPFDDQDPPP